MIITIKEEKLEVLNEMGDSNIVYMKTFRFLGIPLFKSTFIREIDTQQYTPPQESPKPVVMGFGSARFELDDEPDDDGENDKNKNINKKLIKYKI